MREKALPSPLEIVEEEEALLRRALEALHAPRRGSDRPGRLDELRSLREEASEAAVEDLPTLLADLGAAHALAHQPERGERPDSGTPYFAHLRVRTETGPRDYLLGRAGFTDLGRGIRIVDWRFAPVARIFYGYEEGDDVEEKLPGGVLEGVVEARRVVVIERGRLTRIVAGSQVLTRDRAGKWSAAGAQALSGGEGTATRAGSLGVGVGRERRDQPDITALLDAEQFEAINASAERPLLVTGSAGSGKTTVALHRLARLAFEDPARFPPGRLRVLVPEEGLARLSRRLLAPLGLESVKVETVPRWLMRSACAAFQVRSIPLSPETPALVERLKRHPALREPLLARMKKLPKTSALPRLRKRLATLFTDRAFLGSVIEAAGGDLPATAVEDTVHHTLAQLRIPLSIELAGFAPEALAAIDGRPLEEGTPDELAGTLDLEDLALLLFLRAKSSKAGTEPIAHLVVDEAEDFSLFELAVLGQQLGAQRSVTLAGDPMQQTSSGFASWQAALEALGLGEPATCRLQVSYRCPQPVVELARKVLGKLRSGEEPRGRAGAPVGRHHFPNPAQGQLFLAGALRDLLDREPQASVGVVACTPEAARAIAEGLAGIEGVRWVHDGEFTFEPGVDVADVESVKGLEFDYVVVPDATAENYPPTADARRRLHVAVTRASHQLWIISSGMASPLVG